MLTLQEIISTTEGLGLDKSLGMNYLYEEYYILRFCVCVHMHLHALTCFCGSEIFHRKQSIGLSANSTSLNIIEFTEFITYRIYYYYFKCSIGKNIV